MRRPLHCVIVALLCLNLGLDSARACWHVRRRSHCQPLYPTPTLGTCSTLGTWTANCCTADPAAWTYAPQAWAGHVVVMECEPAVFAWSGGTPLSCCCVPGDPHAVVVDEVIHGGMEIDGVVSADAAGQWEPQPTTTEEAVVHSPTIVLGAVPAATDPVPQIARPVDPQPQSAAREPLPDLRPATANAGTLPRADQPVPASLDLPDQPKPPRQDATAAQPLPAAAPASRTESLEMPPAADVDDLAAMPEGNTPREQNLFDLFAEDDEETGERAAPTDEPEMLEERTTDGDDTAPAPTTNDAPAQEAPGEDGAAVEAAAATTVPDEPLRRWTDATGDHHAQGWLVEIGGDEARILKVSGRHTVMALADLSADDQAYVAAVAARLAAGRSAAAANDTAGL